MSSSLSDQVQTVLIVDDNATSRLKLKLAVEALGYCVVTESNGHSALTRLEIDRIDLVLLDIVMPEMDGFEVLQRVKSNPMTSAIPVLIISSLDDDTDNVVKGIKFGAVDFLPKQINPALLRARINASLERKRLHDVEQVYRQHVDQLISASTIVEQGIYNPTHLDLEKVQARPDALGKFGRLFTSLAQDIYQRERRLNRQVMTLKGMLLMLATGTVIGISVPLSKIGASLSDKPFGLTAWVLFFAALFGIGIATWRRTLPPLSSAVIRFLLFWGFITTASQVLLFWIAGHLQASLLSIILVTEGFMVFGFAAIMKIEQAQTKRLIGLLVGFFGVTMIIVTGDQLDVGQSWIWIVLALTIPLVFAIEDIFIAARLPEDWDPIGAVGLVSLVALMLTLPVVFLTRDAVPLSLNPGQLELIIILLALETLVGTTLMVLLLKIAGPVFGSQVGYVMTFAGIGWSFVLLDEHLPLIAWIALGVIFVGLLLVEPKEEAEPLPDLPDPPAQAATGGTIPGHTPMASQPHR